MGSFDVDPETADGSGAGGADSAVRETCGNVGAGLFHHLVPIPGFRAVFLVILRTPLVGLIGVGVPMVSRGARGYTFFDTPIPNYVWARLGRRILLGRCRITFETGFPRRLA